MPTNTQYEADGTITRRCHACRQRRPLTEFKRNNAMLHGRGYMCKKCHTNRYSNDKSFNSWWQNRFNIARKRHRVTVNIAYIRKLWTAQTGKCALTGVAMVFERRSPFAASMDRINLTVDYVPGNIRLVTIAANLARRNYTDEQFQAWLAAVRAV